VKSTLLAACAAVAICGAVPVVSAPAHAQEMSTLTIAQLEDRLTGMMLVDGKAATSTQAYTQAYLELKERMEGKPTADQLNRFQNFPKPVPVTKAENSAGGQPDTGPVIVYFGFDREKLTEEAHQTLDEVVETFVSEHELADRPEVIKVSPGRNAEGVAPGTAFVLTFSEPMDEANVEDNFVIRSFSEEEDAEENSDGGQWYDGLDTSNVQESVPGTDSPEDDPDTTLGGPIFKDKVWFFAGASQINIPKVGYGVEVTDDDEQFVARTDGYLSGQTYGGAYLGGFSFTDLDEYSTLSRMQRKWRGRANAFTTTLSYTQADGSSSGSVPAGGNGTGVVYFDFASDGATGLFYGSAGSDVETSTDYESFRFTAGRKVYHEISPDWYWGCYHGLFYDYSDTEHEFGITTPTYPDIYTFGRQDLTERYAGVEFGPFFGRKFGKVNTFVRPMVNFGYREADLDSEQNTFCGLCSTSAVDIVYGDNDSGFAYGGSLDAGMEWEIVESLGLGVIYSVYARTGRGAIKNPESGDDLYIDNQPTQLSTQDEIDQTLLFTLGKSW